MPESIVVIGCGPAGMFFCHAMETMRREMLERGESIDNLPSVTVFERDASPGGVWRSERNQDQQRNENQSIAEEKKIADIVEPIHNTQMYEALWTNGVKEGIEFFDYTYDEHFKRQLPVYMPRGALLEYMLARVTKNCPDIFEKYVQFQTSVVKVVYDEEIAKFRVMTRSLLTGVARTDIFDRCIWAAGEDGKPKMPKGVLKKLDRFSGKVMHSTDTASFKEDVFGKRVLIVGGSYSAEDLALMACKVGVERVYVCCRAGVVGDPAVLWTENWPHDKVEVFEEKTLVRVENSSTVILQETECIRDDNYEINKKGQEVRLEDIDTIILCTGYHQQLDMLEPKLKDWTQNEKTATFPVPADWRMNENRFSPLVGEVAAPAEARYYGTSVHNCELYRGLLIDNPRMMFLRHDQEDYPILNIDVMAWLFVQVCTGRRQIFSAAEMRQKNVEQALSEMKMLPTVRFHTDVDYAEAYEEAAEEKDPEWELFDESLEDEFRASFHTMARIMVEANYPLCIGSYTELNEKGRKLHEYAVLSVEHRSNATASTTFRDTTDSHKFTSIFTGTAAVPLKKAWLEIDENKDKDIV